MYKEIFLSKKFLFVLEIYLNNIVDVENNIEVTASEMMNCQYCFL